MNVEFDSAKDDINLAKHGVSLAAAVGFDWDTAFEREDDRFDYGEMRFVAIGLIEGRLFVMASPKVPMMKLFVSSACAGGET